MMVNGRRALMGKATLLLPLILVVLLSLPAPVSADTFEIKEGGSYLVLVDITKPLNMRLYEGTWEIRAYFYDGTNCFTVGDWWQPSGSTDWIYSGWYDHKIIGDDWGPESSTRTFQIPVTIVSHPRPAEDKSHGMQDFMYGQSATLRLRLLIQDVKPTFSGSTSEGSGSVSFTVGGVSYRYTYQVDQYGDINLSGQDLVNAKLDYDTSSGEYRLVIDHDDVGATFDEQAQSTDTFIISTPLYVNLTSFTSPEATYTVPPDLQIVLSVVSVLAAVGAGAYLGLRKKSEELPLE